MRRLLLILPIALCGCMTPSVKNLAPVIRELARDTNSISLRITSPAFGTLEFERNMPPQPKK